MFFAVGDFTIFRIRLSLLIALGIPFPLAAQEARKPLAFTHVTVIDCTGDPPKPDMTVVVTGDRIAAIGKTGDVVIPKDARVIDASGKFMLNVIGEDPSRMFAHFGKGFSPEEDAFEGLSFRTTGFGPIIESCIAHLKCEVRETVAAGDHVLYVAEVTGAGVVEDATPYCHLRKTGMSY